MSAPKEALRTAGDIASHSVWIATVLGWLPYIAASLSIAWSVVQLYDRFFRPKKVLNSNLP